MLKVPPDAMRRINWVSGSIVTRRVPVRPSCDGLTWLQTLVCCTEASDQGRMETDAGILSGQRLQSFQRAADVEQPRPGVC